jgi:mRNA-degrading endonuclease YafQ of YafQ-DinJ toxin-antitoxin module
MKRVLLRSNSFIRTTKKLLHKKPHLALPVREALSLLAENAYNPLLRTHKLTGNLQGSWACSAGYDLRIVFSFERIEGKEVILLETIGTHDEVY